MKTFIGILLATISLNAYSFCAWDDHDCRARQAEQDKMQRQLDYQRSEQQRQQQEFDRQQDQMKLEEQRLEFDRKQQDNRYIDTTPDSAKIIRDWNDGD